MADSVLASPVSCAKRITVGAEQRQRQRDEQSVRQVLQCALACTLFARLRLSLCHRPSLTASGCTSSTSIWKGSAAIMARVFSSFSSAITAAMVTNRTSLLPSRYRRASSSKPALVPCNSALPLDRKAPESSTTMDRPGASADVSRCGAAVAAAVAAADAAAAGVT